MTQANHDFDSILHWPTVLSRGFACAGSLSILLGCSLGARPGDGEGSQTLEEPITVACTLQTVGLPCDPDGSGSATECGGVCWIGSDRQPQCRTLPSMGMQTTDLNGRICGDATGQDCAHSCENGQCVAKNARLGAACRPSTNSSTCDGLCTLSGGNPVCDRVNACNDFGVNGCTLRACGFDDNTTGCQDYLLSVGTSCDDGLSCTTGDSCDSTGRCVPAVNSCGGAGGAGGASAGAAGKAAGAAGRSGGTGPAGAAGQGGAQAGAGGKSSGGTGPAGAAGKSGGTGPAGAAGSPATGGRSGAAGSVASAGKSGAAGLAGTAGGGGVAGLAGAAGKSLGAGGRFGTGGVPTPAGEDSTPAEITGGGCSTSGAKAPWFGWSVAMLLGLAARRRQSKRQAPSA